MNINITDIRKVIKDAYSSEHGIAGVDYEEFYNINSKDNFQYWKKVFENINKKDYEIESKSSVYQFTDPAFTENILIKTTINGNFVYKQYMVVHLSLIGNYYTLYGKETISIKTSYENNTSLEFSPIIFVSPCCIYEKWFDIIFGIIKSKYKNYYFIPYFVLKYKIKNINTNVYNNSEAGHSVFELLFGLDDI